MTELNTEENIIYAGQYSDPIQPRRKIEDIPEKSYDKVIGIHPKLNPPLRQRRYAGFDVAIRRVRTDDKVDMRTLQDIDRQVDVAANMTFSDPWSDFKLTRNAAGVTGPRGESDVLYAISGSETAKKIKGEEQVGEVQGWVRFYKKEDEGDPRQIKKVLQKFFGEKTSDLRDVVAVSFAMRNDAAKKQAKEGILQSITEFSKSWDAAGMGMKHEKNRTGGGDIRMPTFIASVKPDMKASTTILESCGFERVGILDGDDMYGLNPEKYQKIMKNRGRESLIQFAQQNNNPENPTLIELLSKGKTLSEMPQGLPKAPIPKNTIPGMPLPMV